MTEPEIIKPQVDHQTIENLEKEVGNKSASPIVAPNSPATPTVQPGELPKTTAPPSRKRGKKTWGAYISVVASGVIIFSLLAFGYFTFVGNSDTYNQQRDSDLTEDKLSQTNGSDKVDEALPGGGTVVGSGGASGQNSPKVTVRATPSSVKKGGSVSLEWESTNNPTSCSASEDWSGDKPLSGTETVANMTETKTYLFTLTCKNSTGTGFSTVSVGVIEQSQVESPQAPIVTLSANPTAIYAGDSSTLIWEVSNNPQSCQASGDWVGEKPVVGPETTGNLTAAKDYYYTLTCTNDAGSGSAKTSIKVRQLPDDIPVVYLSSNPVGPVSPGEKVALSWSTVNNPDSCQASGDWSGSRSISGGNQAGIVLQSIKTYEFELTCSNNAGTTNDVVSVQVLPRPPVVALSLSPSSIQTGGSATVQWSGNNNPTSCTASGGTGIWGGNKSASGSQSTAVINTAKTYYYSLTCQNAGGTGYANNVPLQVTQPTPPTVTITASPITIEEGSSSLITWSVSGSATTCSASGKWSGGKSTAGGSQSTGNLNTAGTYNFTLSCSNSGGNNSASTSVIVTQPSTGGGTAPVITLSASPTTIGTGSSATLSWSASNSPTMCSASGSWSGSKGAGGSQSTGSLTTAGTRTYTLGCSNSAGSDSKSVQVNVIAIPVVTLSANPTTIQTGQTHSLSWSATGSPTSCNAASSGGNWTGSKAVSSGPINIGPINSAGTYTYTLTCSNTGGSDSATAVVTVNQTTVNYCGGKTPCYGPSDMTNHNTLGDCWAYNKYSGSTDISVYNITNFNNSYHKSKKNLLPGGSTTAALCGDVDIQSFLSGGTLTGVGNHGHKSSTRQNNNSTLSSYRVGYYDANKP